MSFWVVFNNANAHVSIVALLVKYVNSLKVLFVSIGLNSLICNIIQKDNSPCDSSPCLNGGACLANRFSCNYQCQCPFGYTGPNCQIGDKEYIILEGFFLNKDHWNGINKNL